MAHIGHDISVRVLGSNPIAALYISRLVARYAHVKMLDFELPFRSVLWMQQRTILVVDAESLSGGLPALLRSIRALSPSLPIIAIGKELSREGLSELLLLGLNGFVAARDIEHQLPRALREVWRGHLSVEKDVLETCTIRAAEVRPKHNRGGLTGRERGVVQLLERGLSNKEIGAILGITNRTVKFHVANILAKLGAQDRHAAVAAAKAQLLLRGSTDSCGADYESS